jgi:hypothetical protein
MKKLVLSLLTCVLLVLLYSFKEEIPTKLNLKETVKQSVSISFDDFESEGATFVESFFEENPESGLIINVNFEEELYAFSPNPNPNSDPNPERVYCVTSDRSAIAGCISRMRHSIGVNLNCIGVDITIGVNGQSSYTVHDEGC